VEDKKVDNKVTKSNEQIGLELLDKITILPTMKLDKAFNSISKKVVQRGSQWCVIHCSGPDAGKAIKCFPTKGKADAMHGAIMANKSLKQFGVPKDTKERLISHFGLSEEQATKLIDNLGEEEADKLLPQRGTGIGLEKQDGRPPKAQWDACIRRAEGLGSISDPEAFCGDLYYHKKTHFDAFSKGEEISTKSEGVNLVYSTEKIISEDNLSKLDKALRLLK